MIWTSKFLHTRSTRAPALLDFVDGAGVSVGDLVVGWSQLVWE